MARADNTTDESRAADQQLLESDLSTSQEHPGYSRWNSVVMILVMLAYTLIAVLVILNGYNRVEYFRSSHHNLADYTANNTANHLEAYLQGLQGTLKLFVESRHTEIQEALDSPGNPDQLQKLFLSLRPVLPDLHGLAVATADGTLRLEQELGLVNDMCLAQVRGMSTASGVAIHPSPQQVHFDVLTRLPGSTDLVLVASFKPDALVHALANAQSEGHTLVLSDLKGGNVQVSASGYLTQESNAAAAAKIEQGELLVARPVNGSDWTLYDVLDRDLLSANTRNAVIQSVLLLAVSLLVISLTVRLLVKRNRAVESMSRELRELNEQLRYQSLHDDLTGLPNRTLLEDRLKQKVYKGGRTGGRFLLALVNLNEFSRVNESLGYEVGDQLLKAAAARLTRRLREVDTVARFESDVFAVVMDIRNIAEAEFLSAKVLDVLQQPFDVGETPVNIGASLGVACFPTHGKEERALINGADIALNKIKDSPEKTVQFASENAPGDIDRLALLSGFNEALESGQLFMVYQPKLSLTEPRRHELEALLRWDHPRFGGIPCDTFIPLVEQTKNIVLLTHWTVNESLKMLKSLTSQGREIGMAINLSAKILDEEGFPLWLQRAIDSHGIEPASVRLELTETAMMSDFEKSLKVLLQLAALGVGLSVDDFGVGQSSLAYISRLPVDELKIDKTFVSNMSSWESDRAIVKATIDLAHDLGLKVVAEGVETLEQATMLREMECDMLQGHYIAWPMTAEQLAHWLARQAA
ncbi:MAG: putative bifunctional diguanylate cyclase/phosphodiesterase [bacterium]